MFKDVYKRANEDIIPDPELLDKVLSNTSKTSKSRSFQHYGSLLAACFILVGTLWIYPDIKDGLNQTTTVPDIKPTEEPLHLVLENIPTPTASTAPTKTPASTIKSKNAKKQASQVPTPKQNTIIPESEQKNEAALPPPSTTTSPETNDASIPEYVSSGGGGGSYFETTEVPIPIMARSMDISSEECYQEENVLSEEQAINLAEEIFLLDFGKDFVSSSELKAEYNEFYTITRYTENENYTVNVFNDGTTQKQY